MTNNVYTKNQLIPELKVAIQALFKTKTQCREMLQLVDNLNSSINTTEEKTEHARQQDYWASNLVYVSEHLSAMEESLRQIESGKIKPSKSIKNTVDTVVSQAKEFAEHISGIYQKIIYSIAPIDEEVRNEIALEQQH